MRIYYVHPLMVGPIGRWPAHLSRCREMGFDHIATAPIFAPGSFGDIFLTGDHEAIHPALQTAGPADRVAGELCKMCRSFGLNLIIDIFVDRVAADGHLARREPQWFRAANLTQPVRIDPRAPLFAAGAVSAR